MERWFLALFLGELPSKGLRLALLEVLCLPTLLSEVLVMSNKSMFSALHLLHPLSKSCSSTCTSTTVPITRSPPQVVRSSQRRRRARATNCLMLASGQVTARAAAAGHNWTGGSLLLRASKATSGLARWRLLKYHCTTHWGVVAKNVEHT